MDADQIAVLDGGTLLAVGRHAELLRQCPTYAEIVASQLSPQEAA
jgi:ATP-binding cassette subfamily B protein